MSEIKAFSAQGMAIRTAATLFLFVTFFTAALSGAYLWTKPAIEASAAEEKMKLVDEVIPRADYDNALLDDTLALPATAALGLDESGLLYRARRAGQPVAVIFETVAPDGYSGKIRLLVAIRYNGTIAGVRAMQHKETPGLGDYIEPKKDKNKLNPWINQFRNISYSEVAEQEWKVKKDGGRFDYHAGATVTPRAVIKAIYKAARWATEQGDALYAQSREKP